MSINRGVSYILPILNTVLFPKYRKIRDCLSGSLAVKEAGPLYLPMPNPTDQTAKNKARYQQYIERAVFYNVTERTQSGMLGQVFAKDPVVELPTGLEHLEADANGENLTLGQFSKRVLNYNLAYARAGLFVDFPETSGLVSRKEIEEGYAVPVVRTVDPMNIINWRTESRGSKQFLTLVVIEDLAIVNDDGFEYSFRTQWRELRLIEGVYYVRLWEAEEGNDPYIVREFFAPTGADGKTLNFIPFTFVGAMNNDVQPDNPAMYNLADLNIAHYRNSADWEESSYTVGQPTVAVTGLTENWWKEVMKEKIEVGSRGGLALPQGATAEILQVGENTMPAEGMRVKEEQMIAIGAQLITPKTGNQTATEDQNEESTSRSVLASSTRNAASGIEQCLKWACIFSGDNPDDVKFGLNQDFEINKMSTAERAQLIKEWQQGALTFEEMRGHLRSAGIATEEDDVARDLIDEEMQAAIDMDKDDNEGAVNGG